LKRFDTNGDGMIDAKEAADENAKNMLERVWRRMGKEPHYPIAITELVAGYQSGGSGGPGGSSRGGPPSPAVATTATSASSPAATGGLTSLPGMGFGTPSAASTSKPGGSNLPAGPPSGNTGPAKAPASTVDDKPAPKKLGRFHTGAELRPKGLPDWFIEKDTNGDGQITMAQFATDWTPELVAKFARYDLNHDGIITAEEVLKVEAGKAK
jgi:hypothetical protein